MAQEGANENIKVDFRYFITSALFSTRAITTDKDPGERHNTPNGFVMLPVLLKLLYHVYHNKMCVCN